MDTHPSGKLEHKSVPETSPSSAEQTSIPDTCRAKTREKRLNPPMYHLMIDDEAFGLWRQVAADRKLATDTQVASFLLQHYHRTPPSYCCVCHSPLTPSCVSCASTQENLNAGIPATASRSHQGVSVGLEADGIDSATGLRANVEAFPPPKSATMNKVATVGKLSEAEDDTGEMDVGLKDTRAGNEESDGQAFIRRRSTRKRAPTKRTAEMTDDVEKVLQKLISGQETLAYTDASSTESEEYQLYLRLMSKLEMLPDPKGHRLDPDFVIDDSRKVKKSSQPQAKGGKRGRPKAAGARSKLNQSGQPKTVTPKSKLARTRSRSELARTGCKGVKSAVKSDNPKSARVRRRGFPQSIERKYKCEKCRSSFFGSNDLRRHMRTHTGEKPYVCEKCGAAFALASTLKRHNMGHSATRPFHCLECGSAFYSAAYLQKHQRVHTGDRPYLCDECGAAFIQPGNLQTHIKKNHTGEMPYMCQTCCARFKTANHLEIHARVHKGPDPYQCTECGAGFPSYVEMKEHKRTHIGRCELKCGPCGEIFKTSKLLTLHMETHTLDARDTDHHAPLQTVGADKDLCLLQTNSHQFDSSQHEGNKFVKCSDPNVIIPLQDENSRGMFVCNVCSAVLPSFEEWRQHTQTHDQSYTQSGTQLKTHACPTCHSTFKTATKLKEHIRIHTGEKPFLCKQCNAAFSNVTNLKAHTRTHTGFRPYVCKTCNASFTISSNLKTHMRVHTGERPYGCGQCSLAFTQRASLRRHMRTHTGDRPYMCEQCSACFMAPSNLKRHMKTHTLAGRKATTCEKCGAQFSVPANMQTGKECSVPFLCRQCSSSLVSTHNLIAASVPSVLAPSNPARIESRRDTRDESRHEIRIPNVLSASIPGAISASSDCTALNPKNQEANASTGEPAMGPTMGLRNVLQSADVVKNAIDTVVSMGSNADVPVALDSSHMQVIKITLETLYKSH